MQLFAGFTDDKQVVIGLSNICVPKSLLKCGYFRKTLVKKTVR